jgi:Ca2+-binding EF-hand superfamily protein
LPIDQLFRLFDVAGVGMISSRAVLTQMSMLKDDSDDHAIRFVFDVYDRNGDGSLSKEEIGSVLRTLLAGREHVELDHEDDAVERKIEEIFERLDRDGNGSVDFDEFKQGILLDPVLVEAFVSPMKRL